MLHTLEPHSSHVATLRSVWSWSAEIFEAHTHRQTHRQAEIPCFCREMLYNWLLWLQVRHFVRECIPEFKVKPKSHILYNTLLSQPDAKHLISHFVAALPTQVEAGHLREAWAVELGVPVLDKLWEEGLSGIQSCSISSRYRWIQFKVLHRLHYSKTKLNKIFESV